MKDFDPQLFARENIRRLTPYSSARSEFAGDAEIFLDANENSNGSPVGQSLNRYPDPLQTAIKERVAAEKGVAPNEIFVGNGSDEAIDLLFRIFCEPRRDEVVICPPTYGMYRVSADINDVPVREVRLTDDFQLDADGIREQINERTKLLFICSPNNPTGNAMKRDDILGFAEEFDGVVVVDEAYADFSSHGSLIGEIREFTNLVVLQTFSKAWGLAGLRVGLAFADERIIDFLNRVKPPYNVSRIAQDTLLKAMNNRNVVEQWIAGTIAQRARLSGEFAGLEFVTQVYPSDANFLLVKINNANSVYKYLLDEKIVVRNRSNVILCGECLRITVGTGPENDRLMRSLENFERRSTLALR